jgi:hypothetical protein
VRKLLSNPAGWVFLILLGSNAFFWHSRDWNTASRLMLTYALVDHHTVVINGLEEHTGDRAKFEGQWYSDKAPGFALLAAGPYLFSKLVCGVPSHPLGGKPRDYYYWVGDYWVTLFTSGLLTAATGALLVYWSRCLGCRASRAALLGLAYGLATPAYVYATLANGHQATAFALFTSFFLLWQQGERRRRARMFLAGFLAAFAAVIELHVGPVSAIMGFYLIFQCIRRDRSVDDLAFFGIGAAVPTLILLGYNQLAFGSPWEMGYFHHATPEFAEVHNAQHPLGLAFPDSFWERLGSLLWGRHRGLSFYAPILLLTVPGWAALFARRRFAVAWVTILVVASVLLVNICYPEWTGGWSTGPRLLVPLLPFAVLPIAGLLSGESTLAKVSTWFALLLALAGGVEMFLFQGADGRIPHDVIDPIAHGVWPLWSGEPVPWWRFGDRFCRNLTVVVAPDFVANLPPRWQGVQFLPVLLFQAAGILGLWRFGLDRGLVKPEC